MLPLIPALALLLQLPAPADTLRPAWTGTLSYDLQSFRGNVPGWSSWKTLTGSVQRKLARATVVLEGLRSERFGRVDAGGAAELYLPLSRRAYAAVRLQAVPDADVLPRLDAALEIFQALPHGLELSGAARDMDYPDHPVRIYSAGLARYSGEWYLRTRWSVIPGPGADGWSGVASARRYFAPPLEFAELAAGGGLEPVTVAAGRVQLHQSRFVGLRLQRFLTPALGVLAGAALNTFEDIPDRFGATAGLMLRW